MSLDITLITPGQTANVPQRIPVRIDGQNVLLTPDEWNKRFPDRPVSTITEYSESDVVFEYNITHNLSPMAEKAGLFAAMWEPQTIGATKAGQLIEPLEKGLAVLLADPDTAKLNNPPNGWGSYEGLVAFAERYLEACKQYPEAVISASR